MASSTNLANVGISGYIFSGNFFNLKATYIGYLKAFSLFGHVSTLYLLLHHTLISTTSVGFTIKHFFKI